MATREVTNAQYEQIQVLLRQANEFREAAKGRHLTLKQKLALLRQADRLRDAALELGMEAE